MKEGYWVIRTYVSGNVGEKIKYWISGARPTRSERRMKYEIRKIQQNYTSSEKELARLINANFKQGDILLGLDYSEEGYRKLLNRAENYDADTEADRIFQVAAHEANLCARRVKREAQKLGIEIKSIITTSDMDGDTGERVRVHHHLVINREAAELFEKKWKLGGVNRETLSAQEDYTPIANYLIRQVRHIRDVKKYTSSRNLERPKGKDRIAVNNSELRVPKGTKLLYRNQYIPYMPQYMRYYILPKEDNNGLQTADVHAGGAGADNADGVDKNADCHASKAKPGISHAKRRTSGKGNGGKTQGNGS